MAWDLGQQVTGHELWGETHLGSRSRSSLRWLSSHGGFPKVSKPGAPTWEPQGRDVSLSTRLLQGLNVTTHEKTPRVTASLSSHQCVRVWGVYRYLVHLPLAHLRPEAPHERESLSLRLLLHQIPSISGSQDNPLMQAGAECRPLSKGEKVAFQPHSAAFVLNIKQIPHCSKGGR